VYLWQGKTATDAMTKARLSRQNRQTVAATAWQEIRTEGAKLVKSGLLSGDVWLGPYMWLPCPKPLWLPCSKPLWLSCSKPLWLPDGCTTLADIADIDVMEPSASIPDTTSTTWPATSSSCPRRTASIRKQPRCRS